MFDGDGRAVQTSDLFFVQGQSAVRVLSGRCGSTESGVVRRAGVLAADNTDEMMIDLPHDLLAAIAYKPIGRWGGHTYLRSTTSSLQKIWTNYRGASRSRTRRTSACGPI